MINSEFELLNIDEITSHMKSIGLAEKAVTKHKGHNYCEDCDIPCTPTSEGYTCPQCSKCWCVIGERYDANDENKPTMKIVKIGNNRNLYSGNQDYSKVQKKNILNQLLLLNSDNNFTREILISTMNMYNEIQNIYIDNYDDTGENIGQKKFVKRGACKDEVIGACLYYQSTAAGIPRTRKFIADFMKLPNSGISKGEKELRALGAKGKIALPVINDGADDFVERFLSDLGLYNEDAPTDVQKHYKQFVLDIYNTSIKCKVGVSLMMLSKIVGAVWILVSKAKLNKTTDEVEAACDNVRATTFLKFATQVNQNMRLFLGAFLDHNIPHGMLGKISKVKR